LGVLASQDLETIRLTVRKLGNYAAATIRDLSYQTEPMLDAQQRGRERVINLDLAGQFRRLILPWRKCADCSRPSLLKRTIQRPRMR
jgi:hypothetical protein